MKIAILSREPNSYSTKQLVAACLEKKHEVEILNTLKFSIHVERGNPQLYYEARPVEGFDAVIPRIGASLTFFGTAVVRQFEQMGVFCLNSSLGITVSRDKLRAIQILSRHNIDFPVTQFIKHKKNVLPAIENVGGSPVIIKLLEGTQGVGVILAETKKVAEAIIETLQSTKQNVLIQKFVKESKGKDIRALVVGGKVIAAMRRSAQGDEFRSNVHRGGTVEGIQLNEAFEQAAIHSTQILGLNVAGVDMLEGADGPKLMEVNSSPGFEGIEQATKINISKSIVEFIEEQVLFPEVDIRQRLTLKSGYGVAEFPIHPESELVNKQVKDSGLRGRDIVVMSIMRGSITIPNPKGTREILAGDRLLCYGKMETLKTLLPAKTKTIRNDSKQQ